MQYVRSDDGPSNGIHYSHCEGEVEYLFATFAPAGTDFVRLQRRRYLVLLSAALLLASLLARVANRGSS
jgi:hypothetical protein